METRRSGKREETEEKKRGERKRKKGSGSTSNVDAVANEDEDAPPLPVPMEPPLPNNISLLLDSYLTTLLAPLTDGIDFQRLIPKFSWINSDKYEIKLKGGCPVPPALNQGEEGICIVMATKTLLQFQMNLIAMEVDIVAPELSLAYMKWIFETVIERKTVAVFLDWIKTNGLVAVEDYENTSTTRTLEDAKRYFIDFNYGFLPGVDEFDWTLKNAILRYGGVLCEMTYTRDFRKGNGKKVYESVLSPEYVGEWNLELAHVVAMFGWGYNKKKKRVEFEFLNSYGENFGIKIGIRKGNGRTIKKTIRNIFVPQLRKWWP